MVRMMLVNETLHFGWNLSKLIYSILVEIIMYLLRFFFTILYTLLLTKSARVQFSARPLYVYSFLSEIVILCSTEIDSPGRLGA